MTPALPDLLILGAGPAGLALAAAAAERGLAVQVVDPSPASPWPATYGAWVHDLPPGVPVARTWREPTVDLGNGTVALPGAYARIDKAALRASLLARLTARGGTVETGRATSIVADPAHGRAVALADGRTLYARCVVDATSRGVEPRAAEPTAFQTAWGVLARVSGHPWGTDGMALMDFSVDHLHPEQAAGPSSFLYALPLAPDLVFFEETSLAADPALPLTLLRDRLELRLAHLGIQVVEELEIERCTIPMNTPIPRLGLALPFGASAALMHPATGYQLTRSLALAPVVADTLARRLPSDPDRAVREAWRAIWPMGTRRTRALHDLGLQLLLSLDAAQTRRFFDIFFSIPEPSWRAYLSATSSPGSVARAMTQVFARLDPSLRSAIVALALGRGRHHLLRVLTPPIGGAP